MMPITTHMEFKFLELHPVKTQLNLQLKHEQIKKGTLKSEEKRRSDN